MFYDIYLYTLCYYICCLLGACMRCTRLCPLKPGVTKIKLGNNRFIVADNSTISRKCNDIYIHTWAFWRSLVVDQVFSQQVVLLH